MDSNRDGVVDDREFLAVLRVKEQAAQDVERMDCNGDGVVDEQEFLAGGGIRQEFDRWNR